MSDPVDIKLTLEKKCLEHHCQADVKHYEACCERIKSIPADREPHCFPQYFEVVHCVDHCVDPQLWKTLK
ncbi:ubiquinol-cytochrome c reductase, putative [Bodo saltans]|uniref:Ubiquinol-cytochrome c reductase, putative n=1 Tax=Bodo saltans TaxID=75058 RepID=A0A0S4KMS1_BODSA|nr:ubiquinol-cytochrome c reductase, putative [Bodo saltans]|eukprot:CUI14907.1 ubiquinol-cytochrome c reductase, putative [Bodo saltans]